MQDVLSKKGLVYVDILLDVSDVWEAEDEVVI